MVRRASVLMIAVHKKEGFLMHVVLTQQGTNQKVDVKLGFSWTSLLLDHLYRCLDVIRNG